MATSPNNDPWARGFLEHIGEDPDQEKMDRNIPDEWFNLPNFQYARRIGDTESIDESLGGYDKGRFRAEYRSLDAGGEILHYVLVFLRDDYEAE